MAVASGGTQLTHALIIEDEPVIAFNVEAILTEIGYRSFDVATTEAEAVRVARQRRPSLIIADERLRPGSGIAAVHTICAEELIPVVHILGVPDDAAGRAVGHAVCLAKPFTADRLMAAVEQALGRVEVEHQRADGPISRPGRPRLRLVE